MKKYYIVTKESKVYEQYWKYNFALEQIQKAFVEFTEEHNINSKEFHALADRLYIVPVQEDIERFGQDFVKNNVGMFKKKTHLSNEWIKKCREEKIKTPNKPFIPFIFNCADKCLWQLFDIDDVIYCTFESQSKFIAPKEFKEIEENEFAEIMRLHNIKF